MLSDYLSLIKKFQWRHEISNFILPIRPRDYFGLSLHRGNISASNTAVPGLKLGTPKTFLKILTIFLKGVAQTASGTSIRPPHVGSLLHTWNSQFYVKHLLKSRCKANLVRETWLASPSLNIKMLISDNWKLLLTNNAGAFDKSVEIINFKSNNSVCAKPPDYPLFCKTFNISDTGQHPSELNKTAFSLSNSMIGQLIINSHHFLIQRQLTEWLTKKWKVCWTKYTKMRFSFPLMLIEYPVRNRAEPLFKELIMALSSPLFCFVLVTFLSLFVSYSVL